VSARVIKPSLAQLVGPGEKEWVSRASCSSGAGGGSRVVTLFCPSGPLDAGETPAVACEGALILTALERTLRCSDVFCLMNAQMCSESSGLTIYWSGAMVACVGLMVMACKARRNGLETSM